MLKIKLTSAEFLSGLRKGDLLLPIITAVVYLGEKPWDGPRSLYDMLDIKNEALKKYIPNYWINLISPADMDEDDFDKFHTGLGFAMRVIKHQSEDADAVIMATNHKKIDRETAVFLNNAVNLKLEYEEGTGGVDMCKALERKEMRDKVTGAIEMLRLEGTNDEDIITKVMRLYNVTREYVLDLLNEQVA